MKVLHAHLQEDPSFEERFVREARTMARLDHPNIMRVYDVGHREGINYLVMEFVDGVTLRQTMAGGGLMPEEALSMVPRICGALQYAHDQGVVHRDIKPENILLNRSGAPKIADFGLALLTGPSTETRLTQTAQVMGTPQYMAPEQIEHPGDVDHRADIYSLGVVFYEMLTGGLPVGRFPPPSQNVEVDVRLDQVVLRTLEKEPRLRYQQASELRAEVESLADPSWKPDLGGQRRGHQGRNRYEFRSKRTVWGMAMARGVIAIGDTAVGLIAVGAFAFGGLTVGGMSLGLISVSGFSVGLLLAIGGVGPLGGSLLGVWRSGWRRPAFFPSARWTYPPRRCRVCRSLLGAWSRPS